MQTTINSAKLETLINYIWENRHNYSLLEYSVLERIDEDIPIAVMNTTNLLHFEIYNQIYVNSRGGFIDTLKKGLAAYGVKIEWL